MQYAVRYRVEGQAQQESHFSGNLAEQTAEREYEKISSLPKLLYAQLMRGSIDRETLRFEPTSYLRFTGEQAEAEPIDLASQRTKRAMHDLATSSDVLEGDLSNGLDPIEPEEE